MEMEVGWDEWDEMSWDGTSSSSSREGRRSVAFLRTFLFFSSFLYVLFSRVHRQTKLQKILIIL